MYREQYGEYAYRCQVVKGLHQKEAKEHQNPLVYLIKTEKNLLWPSDLVYKVMKLINFKIPEPHLSK